MRAGHVVVVVTCVVVAGLGAWLALARWDDANKVAAVASALGAVAAVGVAVWAALRVAPGGGGSRVRVSDTGDATGGGSANTGVRGAGGARSVRVERTGRATGDDANTGVEL